VDEIVKLCKEARGRDPMPEDKEGQMGCERVVVDPKDRVSLEEKKRKRMEQECLYVIYDHAGCYCGLMPIGRRTGKFQEYYRTECFGTAHGMCPHPEEYKPRGPIEEPLDI